MSISVQHVSLGFQSSLLASPLMTFMSCGHWASQYPMPSSAPTLPYFEQSIEHHQGHNRRWNHPPWMWTPCFSNGSARRHNHLTSNKFWSRCSCCRGPGWRNSIAMNYQLHRHHKCQRTMHLQAHNFECNSWNLGTGWHPTGCQCSNLEYQILNATISNWNQLSLSHLYIFVLHR